MEMSKVEEQGLPEELIIDILYRLPPKSIGLFRCVSKKWNNFLCDPKFINAHFTIHAHKENEQKFILAYFGRLKTITLTQNPHNELIDVESDMPNFQQLSDNWYTVHGSCNGLVLAEKRGNILFLINPTTLKYHEIPKFDMALPEDESKCIYGFGYDVVSDDYKVVTLSYYDYKYARDVKTTFVDVYSVRKGLWRRLESSPYDRSCVDDLESGVLVNGALHWLIRKPSDYSCVISAFDLSDEKFFEVPLPDDGEDYFSYALVALRGRLCIFNNMAVLGTTFFGLMKEYGVKDSWSMFSITVEDSNCIPLCSMTDDDIVMDAFGKLIMYNMKENVVSDSATDAFNAMREVQTFIVSLVSPSYGNGNEG